MLFLPYGKGPHYAKLLIILGTKGFEIRNLVAVFLFGCILLTSQASYSFLPHFKESKAEEHVPINFVGPNEAYPKDAKKILKHAPEGIYISVGTERGLIGFAMADKASHLLLADADPDVVLFNRMNVSLIALALNIVEYRHLRLEASHTEWLKLLKEAPMPKSFRESIASEENFKWFRDLIKNDRRFKPLHNPAFEKERFAFQNTNYLYCEQCFLRVQNAIQEGRVAVRTVDFSESKVVTSMVEAIRHTRTKVSVLDISNAWWENYIDKKNLRETIDQISTVAYDNSLLLMTDSSFLESLKQRVRGYEKWSYFAFTFKKAVKYIVNATPYLTHQAIWEASSRHGSIDLIPANDFPDPKNCKNYLE